MNWWGKILGGTFGLMIGGPIGALLGVVLGHNIDKGVANTAAAQGFGKQERIQTLFYATTFSVMGHVCKADGRVTEAEIELAQQVMQRMEMNAEQRKTAIKLFNEGKRDSFPLQDIVQQFRRETGFRPNLVRMFIEIQIMAAFADGVMHADERRVLLSVCEILGITKRDFEHLCHALGSTRSQSAAGAGQATGLTLKKAFAILDLPENASKEEIRKAYRRLISQHHPDKLVSKGLPEEMMKLAAERTHEIKQAYEFIKASKGY